MNILDYHIQRRGGVVAGPQGLGILIGYNSKLCPCGWIFVDINNPPPNTQEILDCLSNARKYWPEKDILIEDGKKKNKHGS